MDDACGFCGADMAVRLVVREVRNGHLPAAARATFKKRVRMKPAQLVFSARVEGSLLEDGTPLDNSPATLDRHHLGALAPSVQVRLCARCLAGAKTPREALAVALVALDRALEGK